MDNKKGQCCGKDPNLSSYNPAHLDQNHSQSLWPPGTYSTWLSSFLHCHNDLIFQINQLSHSKCEHLTSMAEKDHLFAHEALCVCQLYRHNSKQHQAAKAPNSKSGGLYMTSPGSGTLRKCVTLGAGLKTLIQPVWKSIFCQQPQMKLYNSEILLPIASLNIAMSLT